MSVRSAAECYVMFARQVSLSKFPETVVIQHRNSMLGHEFFVVLNFEQDLHRFCSLFLIYVFSPSLLYTLVQ